jgi:hypothetical protein
MSVAYKEYAKVGVCGKALKRKGFSVEIPEEYLFI